MSLNRTPLAAISYDDPNGKHIRVFYQAPNGDIKEAFFDEATNWSARPDNTVGVGAKLNTGIGAVHYGNRIHVYYLGPDSKVVERYCDIGGSWVQGALSGRFQAAPYSRLAAINQTKDGPTIHIYYQDTTNKLREIIWDTTAGWIDGTAKLPVALVGTSIAANVDFNPANANMIWVYYQAPDLTLREQWFSGAADAWHNGAFGATKVYPPGASVSAALWGAAPTFDRVAAVDENNQLGITACNGPWSPTVNLGHETITLSDVAIISFAGGSQPASALRLFYQQAGGAIAELASQDGNNWSFVTPNIIA